jgi:hypothetical protein
MKPAPFVPSVSSVVELVAMLWASPIEASIRTLVFPDMQLGMSAEVALRILREEAGQDYGADVQAWIRWAKANGHLASDYPEDLDWLREKVK